MASETRAESTALRVWQPLATNPPAIWRFFFETRPHLGANESEIVKAPLRFGTETTEAFLADHGGGSTFDLIVASEVMYARFVRYACVRDWGAGDGVCHSRGLTEFGLKCRRKLV